MRWRTAHLLANTSLFSVAHSTKCCEACQETKYSWASGRWAHISEVTKKIAKMFLLARCRAQLYRAIWVVGSLSMWLHSLAKIYDFDIRPGKRFRQLERAYVMEVRTNEPRTSVKVLKHSSSSSASDIREAYSSYISSQISAPSFSSWKVLRRLHKNSTHTKFHNAQSALMWQEARLCLFSDPFSSNPHGTFENPTFSRIFFRKAFLYETAGGKCRLVLLLTVARRMCRWLSSSVVSSWVEICNGKRRVNTLSACVIPHCC